MSDSPVVVATFIGYLVLMLLIGWWAYRRTHNLADYILGGRRLGPWPTALSAGASDMSGWLLLGLPGYAYVAGIEALWLVAGLLVGTWLNWCIVARRLRRYSERVENALTIPAFLEQRFQDHTRLLRVVSAIFILIFFLFYTSSGLVAGARLFETVFGLPYLWALSAGTLAIILYTLLGGFLAVSWTDLVQGLLMAVALLIVPLYAFAAMGGVADGFMRVQTVNPYLLDGLTDSSGAPLGWIAIVSLLGWGLGYFGQPHILARFKAIRHHREVGKARHIAVSWTALTLLGATLVGLAAIGYLPQGLEGKDSERAFMLLVGVLFHPLVAGVLLAAVLAAIMSTADSQLLVSSSALAEDFYKALFRRHASQRELIGVGRVAVVAIALLAFVLALQPDSKVLDLVAYAWAGFGAAFGPTIILSLYWQRMNAWGALAGIIVGGLTVVVWKQLSGGLFELYEIVPAFAASMLAIVAVSLLSAPPPPQVVARHQVLVEEESGDEW
ncbi:MAG: sodium/proline symporter PutP [Pseudomonadota bacterium]